MKAIQHGALALVLAIFAHSHMHAQSPMQSQSTEESNGLRSVWIASEAYDSAALAMEWTFKPALEVEKAGTGEAWARCLSVQWALDTAGTGLQCEWEITPTGFYATGDAATAAEWGAIMLQGLRTPSVEHWERVQSEWIANWDATYHTPSVIAERVLEAEMFSLRHPYGERVMPATIEAITATDITGHAAAYWHPNNAVLVFAGPPELQGIPGAWSEILADWPARALQKPALPLPSRPRQNEAFIAAIEGDSVYTAVGQLMRLKPDHADALPLLILAPHLKDASSGLLRVELDPVVGSLHFVSQGNASQAIDAIRSLEQAMKAFMQAAPSPKILAAWKDAALLQTLDALESPLATARLYIDRPDWFKAAADSSWASFIGTVRPNDIQRVAINYLRPANLQVVAVGPLDSAQAIASTFAQPQFLKRYDQNAEPLSPFGPVPDGVTAMDVIRSHYTACGGEDAFKSLKSCRRTGTMEAGGGMVMDVVAEEIFGVGHRTSISIDGQTMMEQIVQPGKGRSIQMGRPRPMPEVEYRRYEPGLYAAELLALEQRDLTAEIIGTYQRPDGQEWVVELYRDGALEQRLFFDATTHLLARSEEHRTGPTGPVQVFIEYREYREFGGIQYATEVVRQTNNQRMVTTIDDVQPNARVDKNQFEWE
jgi:hypothetical protein